MDAGTHLADFQHRLYRTRPGVQQTPPVLRAKLLERVAHLQGKVMWDVGAGSGSIAIEWKLYRPCAEVFAIERFDERCFDIYKNAEQFGADINIINQFAEKEILDILPPPDLIYHGCPGECAEDLYPLLWNYLSPGGCLISNAVSRTGVQRAHAAQARYGGEITVIDAFDLIRHQWMAYKPGIEITTGQLDGNAS